MKTLNQLVHLVEERFPHLKTKDRLHIVSMLQDEYQVGFNDAREMALEAIEEHSEDIEYNKASFNKGELI